MPDDCVCPWDYSSIGQQAPRLSSPCPFALPSWRIPWTSGLSSLNDFWRAVTAWAWILKWNGLAWLREWSQLGRSSVAQRYCSSSQRSVGRYPTRVLVHEGVRALLKGSLYAKSRGLFMALVVLPWKWLTDAPHMRTLVFAQWVIKNLLGGISLPSHWQVGRRAEEKPHLLSKLERKDSRSSWHETENNSVLNCVVPTLRTAGFERRTEVLVLILLLATSVASGKWSDRSRALFTQL